MRAVKDDLPVPFGEVEELEWPRSMGAVGSTRAPFLRGVNDRVWRDGDREPDDLLCSRNARPQKDGEGAARCPSCSQNAHDETVLVRCAQSRATSTTPLADV